MSFLSNLNFEWNISKVREMIHCFQNCPIIMLLYIVQTPKTQTVVQCANYIAMPRVQANTIEPSYNMVIFEIATLARTKDPSWLTG